MDIYEIGGVVTHTEHSALKPVADINLDIPANTEESDNTTLVGMFAAARSMGLSYPQLARLIKDGDIQIVVPPGQKHRKIPESEIIRVRRVVPDNA